MRVKRVVFHSGIQRIASIWNATRPSGAQSITSIGSSGRTRIDISFRSPIFVVFLLFFF